MAKGKPRRKDGGKPRAKGSKAGKAARPFLMAFLLTVALAALVLVLWNVYGWDGYSPRVAFTGWPAIGALAVAGLLAVAYWRGGKPAFWGALAAALVAGGALAWATDALPRL
jgi:hypothetical protein